MVTRQLSEAGIISGIEVLDHAVLGGVDCYYSFWEPGWMESGSIARAATAQGVIQ